MAERTYEGVIPLVSNPRGWGYRELGFQYNPGIFLSGEPNNHTQTPFESSLELAYNHTQVTRPTDFNGPKVALRSYEVEGGRLQAAAVASDYFTLRGLYYAAPYSHQKALKDLKDNGRTDIPIGISAHTILLARDQVVMTINTVGHGFVPGRLSLTLEGQMDPPPKDRSPFHTVQRELREELGEKVALAKIRLLAIAGEMGSNYTSWCFVVSISNDAQGIKEAWERVKKREASALLLAHVSELGQVLLPDTQVEALQKYVVGGSLDPEKVINPHPTVPWRYDCLKDYLSFQQAG